MNVSNLHPIFCKGINNLKHTNLFKLYIKSLYKVKVELPLFFSMANVEKWMSKVCVTLEFWNDTWPVPSLPYINFQALSAHLEYSCFLLMSQARVWPLSQWAQAAQGFVWWESPLATVIQYKLLYMVWEFPTLPYKATGYPQNWSGNTI